MAERFSVGVRIVGPIAEATGTEPGEGLKRREVIGYCMESGVPIVNGRIPVDAFFAALSGRVQGFEDAALDAGMLDDDPTVAKLQARITELEGRLEAVEALIEGWRESEGRYSGLNRGARTAFGVCADGLEAALRDRVQGEECPTCGSKSPHQDYNKGGGIVSPPMHCLDPFHSPNTVWQRMFSDRVQGERRK